MVENVQLHWLLEDVVYLLVEVMNIKGLILQEEVKVGIMSEVEEQSKEEVHVKLKKWMASENEC